MTETNKTELTLFKRLRSSKHFVISSGLILIGVVILMQFARYIVPEFKLDNPTATQTIQWDSPETKDLWDRACADCHSNETVYPWYAYVAPMGWLVAHDTHEGRGELNISIDRDVELDEMIEVIQEGEMPPAIYTLIHRNAVLSEAEQQALIDGLRATFNSRNSNNDDDDD